MHGGRHFLLLLHLYGTSKVSEMRIVEQILRFIIAHLGNIFYGRDNRFCCKICSEGSKYFSQYGPEVHIQGVEILYDRYSLYRFPFRSRTAVQDEEFVCGRGADYNVGLSGNSTATL